jgi:hypothetical protein
MTFDGWLKHTFGVTETELREMLDSPERLALLHYDESQSADKVLDIYRKEYRHECDCYASQGIDLTYLEWLEVFKQTTPYKFHDMCVGTGMTRKEEDYAVWYLRRQYEDFIMGTANPFINN